MEASHTILRQATLTSLQHYKLSPKTTYNTSDRFIVFTLTVY